MASIKIHSNWHGNITLDVSKTDRFAVEAIARFGFATEDLGDMIRIPVITPREARAFVAYCE